MKELVGLLRKNIGPFSNEWIGRLPFVFDQHGYTSPLGVINGLMAWTGWVLVIWIDDSEQHLGLRFRRIWW